MYSWQEECVERVRAELRATDRALVVVATGGGKTIMLSKLLKAITARTLILCNKVALVRQLEKETGGSVYCGTLGRYELGGRIIVATVQTISRCAALPAFDLVVVDEVHTWSAIYETVYKRCGGARLLGLTATPFNSEGYIYGTGKLFPRVTYTKGIVDLTREGVLVPARLAGPQDHSVMYSTKGLKLVSGDYSLTELAERVCVMGKITTQVEDALPRLTDRHKIAWACVSIRHAKMVTEVLSSLGESVAICTSDDMFDEREEQLESFTNGPVRSLVFVSTLSYGWNYPPLDAIVFMRPTRSAALYLQIIGRGLRRSPGKLSLSLLDYAGVVEHNGPIDDPVVRGKGKSKGLTLEERNICVRHCKECGAFSFCTMGLVVPCSACGADTRVDSTQASVRKMSKRHQADAELYSQPIVWYQIRDFSMVREETRVHFIYHLVEGAPCSQYTLTLETPMIAGAPSPFVMGKIRKAKAHIEHNHLVPPGSLAKMLEGVVQSKTFPRLIALSATTHQFRSFSNPQDKPLERIAQPLPEVGQPVLL